MQLEWVAGAGYLQINETEYVLKQCHWHSPSEHTIDMAKGKHIFLNLQRIKLIYNIYSKFQIHLYIRT